MKYIDGFRQADAARALGQRIAAGFTAPRRDREVAIMEVCGSHTMAIARYGIRDVLPTGVRLISGPGCPVCVTPPGYIDAAIELADRGLTIVTFGDMLHVPGSQTTLAECRSRGGRVEVGYSPSVALDLARRHADREVVFLGIGFETTLAPVIAVVDRAAREHIGNFSVLTAFKLVPPALAALRADPEVRVDAFLCPAHVSAIIGADAYRPFAGPGGVPCVIAGFEPLDILLALEGILRQLADGRADVDNQYRRVVTAQGNRRAQELIARLLEPVDAPWRGLGLIPQSGMALRKRYAAYDAARRHGIVVTEGRSHRECRCGDVIKGKRFPSDCPLFGKACTPDSAIGPCMVSSEGVCAAHYKYAGIGEAS